MRVMKFGGTSVGTVESLHNVKQIVEATNGSVIVVVSALGGVTDLLIKGANFALCGDHETSDILNLIESRHRDVVFSDLVPENVQMELWTLVSQLLSKLNDYYTGISLLSDLSAHTLCNVVSLGERMSSLIVSKIVADAYLADSLSFIKTEEWFGKNIADAQLTDSLIREKFAKMPSRVAIAPGFISTDRDTGKITNLGRGGSDYTAALIAAAVGAETLDIWTDVDGFMTADPRIIKEAQVIPHLSFLESMDLCNFGAKVIYPPTIYPVFHKNIPIRILNTFNPSAKGTIITDSHHATSLHPFRGVTSIAETSTIRLSTPSPDPALHTHTLNILSKKGIEVLLSTPTLAEGSLTIAIRRADAVRAMQVLKEELAADRIPTGIPQIEQKADVSCISAVGENLKLHPSTAAQILSTLEHAGIPCLASATGASGFTFSMIVSELQHHDALHALHSLI